MPSSPEPIPLHELTARDCAKWRYFPTGVLPLWVAEMDFRLADEIKEAIKAHVDTDDLGYPHFDGAPGLYEAVAERMRTRYGASFDVAGIDSTASTVAGIVYALRAFAEPGDEVLLLTPLYPPFKRSVEATGRVPVEVELIRGDERYDIDFDALRAAITPRTKLLLLCNPHNPIGRMYTREELTRLADLAVEHDLIVVSDELHADLSLEPGHVPIASLGEEIAKRTITLYGPTKAFNIPGLGISFVFTSDAEIKERLFAAAGGAPSWPSRLAEVAALTAYTEADHWLQGTLEYLKGNRDHLARFVKERLPGVSMHAPQATYLGWLDMRRTDLGERPAERLTESAKVGLSEGSDFGKGGAGFVRLNFATSREILNEALERIAGAIV